MRSFASCNSGRAARDDGGTMSTRKPTFALLSVALCLGLLVASAARAEAPFALNARIEPDPVPFGETFHLVVEVARPADLRLALPDEIPEAKETPRAGEVERKLEPLPNEGEGPARVKETLRIPYLALDLAELKTPEVVLKTSDGEPLEIPSLPVHVKDDGALPEGSETTAEGVPLAEAAGPLVYGVFDARPLVALASFAFSLLSLGLYHVLAKRRRLALPAASSLPVEVARRPAHVVALERLEKLLGEGHLARGEVAPFVARLMDEVLRSYLEDRYGIAAGKRTTRELAEELLSKSAPGLDVALTRALLEQVDLVKFARAELQAEVAHQMAGRVRSLIEATAERPAPAGDEEAA